jgi:hypothetical protein
MTRAEFRQFLINSGMSEHEAQRIVRNAIDQPSALPREPTKETR